MAESVSDGGGEWSSDVARRLIEATIDAIDAHGEAAVRLVEVAATAGVSKSSIYYFFGDREGLISAAEAERYVRSFSDDFDAGDAFLDAGPTAGEWVDVVVGVYASHASDAGRRRRRIRAEILGSAVSRERLAAAVARVNGASILRMAEIVDRAQRMGLTGTTHSPMAISTWAHGVMMGRFQAELLDDPQRERDWDAVTATVIRVIYT